MSQPSRKRIHKRSITCEGYLRDDHLWDIEACLVDTKDYSFASIERGDLPIGEPVHHMLLNVTVDHHLTIKAVQAKTLAAPFGLCQQVPPRFEKIVGIQIGRGWMGEVNKLLGGTEGCTHLLEMLKVIATTAFQTVHPYLLQQKQGPKIGHPSIINSCQGWAADGEVVQTHFPELVPAMKK